ncbi:hypothetical protein BH11VER1_BH11VER1_14430 [soil metagenome]
MHRKTISYITEDKKWAVILRPNDVLKEDAPGRLEFVSYTHIYPELKKLKNDEQINILAQLLLHNFLNRTSGFSKVPTLKELPIMKESNECYHEKYKCYISSVESVFICDLSKSEKTCKSDALPI